MRNYDAALVLGCGIAPDGSLGKDPIESMEMAISLHESGQAPLLICSGSVSYKADFTPPIGESEAMRDYAIRHGVQPEAVVTENESKDTLGNIYFTKVRYLLPRHLGRLAVIPGPNHSRQRLDFLLTKVLGQDFDYDLIEHPANRPGESDREQKSLAILHDWLDGVADGDHEAVYRVMLEKHPGYSADPVRAWLEMSSAYGSVI